MSNSSKCLSRCGWLCGCGKHWKVILTHEPTIGNGCIHFELWHGGDLLREFTLNQDYDDWIMMQYFCAEMERLFKTLPGCRFTKDPKVKTW